MLRPGDVLTHVDEQSVAGSSSLVVVPKLLGPCGTEVKLSFKRLVRESSSVKFATFSVVLVRDRLERVRQYPDDVFGLVAGKQSYYRPVEPVPMKYEVIDMSPSSPRYSEGSKEIPFFLSKPDVRSSFTRANGTSSSQSLANVPPSSISVEDPAPLVQRRDFRDTTASTETAQSYASPKVTRVVEEKVRTSPPVADKEVAKKENLPERNRFDMYDRVSTMSPARKEQPKVKNFRDLSPDPPRNTTRAPLRKEDTKKVDPSNTLSTEERKAASDRLKSLLMKEEMKSSPIKLPGVPGETEGTSRRLFISKAV
ncbi:hypothetical protein GUITHDRAFT_115120 [Guillardia theta CCMP2712]|uniref:PDZ domain-containing protein n=1 Tax=Guillardia theta (strain CCMP2712) TaxID=905079 RepID=L1IRE1_GUITC|nr:hypothetical protein GUITHDRAFT_115120 [Guillardia theta CCMP2712]EKX38793.1 hypothetical protein GUITHDRAFT_115120 [Guillardia theta CCMP2712]|eukprot:XP_005825773.1 hypothetical protein GUITHDRAFT_115120 [Guillardia theta CCMP2712]